MRLDATSEAKTQAEIQKEVEKGSFQILEICGAQTATQSCLTVTSAGDLENRLQALRLELREGRLADSVQLVEE